MLILTNEDIEPLLPMEDCISALEQAYRDLGAQDAAEIPRQDTIAPNSRDGAVHVFKTMSGCWPRAGVAALRLNSDIVHWPVINGTQRKVKIPLSDPGGRYNGSVLLFSTETGQLLSIMNDGVIQKTRVGGTSGVAAKYLARKNSRIMGLLGAGWQAEAHLEAMCNVRPIEVVKVYSPTPESRQRFAEVFRRKMNIAVHAVATPEEAAEGADILVSATNAMTPTIRPEWVKPGMHVTSVRGSEISLEVLKLVDRLAVNSSEPVTAYPIRGRASEVPDFTNGDYSRPDVGLFDLSATPELKDIACGNAAGRQSDDEITCFHNYKGNGLQFAALGSLVYQAAKKKMVGHSMDDRYFTQTVHP